MTEMLSQDSSQPYPLKKRFRVFAIFVPLMAAFVFGAWQIADMALSFAYAGVWIQGPLFLLSALILLLPVYFVFTLLRRKWKTGRFLLPPDEEMAQRIAVQDKIGAAKPFGPQMLFWAPTAFILTVCCIVAALCIAGAMQFHARPHGLHAALFSLLVLLAAVCLFIPIRALGRVIGRRWSAGYYLPSEKEIQAARAKRLSKPTPLWQRILLPIMYWANAILFTESALTHHRYPMPAFERWGIAAIWWFNAGLWTWRFFRPAKCAIPSQLRVTPP